MIYTDQPTEDSVPKKEPLHCRVCPEIVKEGDEHFPFCTKKCHNKYAKENFKPTGSKSKFEKFLERGREIQQFNRIIDFGKNSA